MKKKAETHKHKNINRKSFIKKSIGGLAAGSSLLMACTADENSSNSAQIQRKKHRWKMLTTWAPNFPILGEGCELFADWVRVMSDGDLDIKVYGAGELVPALESFGAVSEGIAELAHGSPYYWAGKVPEAQFFSTVPFGMNAQQMNAWMIGGGAMELWKEAYAPFDLHPMLGGNTGVQMGGWFNKEINSVADLKGLKMRIPGIAGKVLEKAGGASILVSGGEIYTNLERSVIDATEWIGPYHDYLMGFHKIAKYYYTPGWHEPGTFLETMVNKTKYDALPKSLQMILEAAAMKLNGWVLAQFEAKNNEYLLKIVNESEVSLRVFPDDVLATLRKYTNEVLDEMIQDNPKSKKIYEHFNNFRNQISNWSKYSEKAYFEKLSI